MKRLLLAAVLGLCVQSRGYVSEKAGKALNWAGYGVMGASMLLFALAGLWR
jgi:multisubunit Na+/H+ antiporter MnhB subunit